MAWLGGINPGSVQGPDPRQIRPARDPKRARRTIESVNPVEHPAPVDEFEPSPEARSIRDELEHPHGHHREDRAPADTPTQPAFAAPPATQPTDPPRDLEQPARPSLDLRG